LPEISIKKLIRYSILAAAFAAIAGPASAQIIERELHRGVMEGPSHLDPQYAYRAVEQSILTDLFMGLVVQDAAGQPLPGAAESWEVKKKGRRWIFKLREGLKWSDGRVLVAGDFVYAFQRLLSPQSVAPFASMFYPIAGARALHSSKAGDVTTLGVTAKDKRTLIFDLEKPTPHFLMLLNHPAAFPLRKDLIERGDDSWTRPGRMVSNGAYILGEWLPGRYVKLRKNWGFYDPASVNIDNIFYDIVEHGEVALERFFSGELAILSGVRRDRIAGLLETAPEVVRLHPTLTTDYLVFNTKRPPFNDPRVRQGRNPGNRYAARRHGGSASAGATRSERAPLAQTSPVAVAEKEEGETAAGECRPRRAGRPAHYVALQQQRNSPENSRGDRRHVEENRRSHGPVQQPFHRPLWRSGN
jgi:oligopeptide transport system substrate-binding protein